jgi:hypothetical protein
MRLQRHRSSSVRRRGVALVLFALFVFLLAGIAALTVDVGLARISQTEMQNAADTAALEGLRGRDDGGVNSELARRETASAMVTWTFDDDFGATAGDAYQFGAGPTFALSGGIGDTNGSQFLDYSASSVYKPNLELNTGNRIYGDLVAGDPLFSASPVYQLENDEYVRADFDNQDHDGNSKLDAFLVRLRRTNDVQGLDQVDGVSSKGPTLPFLFGLAAFLTSTSSTYAPAFDGITVRATAIAAAGSVVDAAGNSAGSVGRVVSCGLENPTPVPPELPRIGCARFAISRSFFATTMPVDATVTLTYDASGVLLAGGTPVGRFATVTQVGQVVLSGPIPATVGATAYVPVFDTVGARDLCVGFGYASVAIDASSIQLTKHAPVIAPLNASAHLPSGFVGLSDVELQDLRVALAEFDRWSVRAPVLYR